MRPNLSKYIFAEIAQLVEHNLAKVGVASSSLVFRSNEEGLEKSKPFFVFVHLGGKNRSPQPCGKVVLYKLSKTKDIDSNVTLGLAACSVDL